MPRTFAACLKGLWRSHARRFSTLLKRHIVRPFSSYERNMPKRSAGLLMFRRGAGGLEVFLIHPGGPYWTHKDEGAWSVPKGEYGDEEEPLAAAQREFEEETGARADGPFIPLSPVQQARGKTVTAWAFEGDLDPADLRSNVFSLEWPPHSGKMQEFPEADRGAWFSLPVAVTKIVPAQKPLLDELAAKG